MVIEAWLRAAYTANILILLPVVAALWTGPASRIFGGGVADVPALRLLVASLWTAILACSAIGLAAPRAMAAILVLQLVYKALWLALFVVPAWRRGAPVPWGPALTFVPIVALWPVLIALVYGSAR